MPDDPKVPDGTPPASDDKGVKNSKKDTDFVPRGDHDEAVARRDAALKRAQEAEAKLADKEKAEREAKAILEGNIEALRKSAQETEAALKAENAAKDKLLSDTIVEVQVVSALSKIIAPELLDVAKTYVLNDFEVVKGEDGKPKARAKGSSLSIEDYLNKKFEPMPGMLANTRKSGTDTGKSGANGSEGGATEIPSDFGSWDKPRMVEWMKKNPKLAAEAATKALGG